MHIWRKQGKAAWLPHLNERNQVQSRENRCHPQYGTIDLKKAGTEARRKASDTKHIYFKDHRARAPFFEVLKNTYPFSWGPPQQVAFEDLKVYLHNLTTLASPQPSESLLLYVAASPHVISTIIVREKTRRALEEAATCILCVQNPRWRQKVLYKNGECGICSRHGI